MARRDQYKSSYGAFTAQQRELERGRERRDARDAEAAATAATTDAATDAATDAPAEAPADDLAEVTATMPVAVKEDRAAVREPPAVPKAEKTTVVPDDTGSHSPRGAAKP